MSCESWYPEGIEATCAGWKYSFAGLAWRYGGQLAFWVGANIVRRNAVGYESLSKVRGILRP